MLRRGQWSAFRVIAVNPYTMHRLVFFCFFVRLGSHTWFIHSVCFACGFFTYVTSIGLLRM
jgi:hypothetical protein